MRIVAVFEKGERLRHIGHLDIQRAFMRAFRRANLPVSYSKGFNPHILLAFASALSVGYIGKREMLEVRLDQDVDLNEFLETMNASLPSELQLISVKQVDERHPALMAQVCAATYDIQIMNHASILLGTVQGFLAQSEIITQRKTKSGIKNVDIRPLILECTIENEMIHVALVLTETEACKPDMFINALSSYAGVEIPRAFVIRTGLLGKDAAGQLVSLEDL